MSHGCAPAALPVGEAHVWFASLALLRPHEAALQVLLSPSEVARISCYRRSADQQRRIIARGMLRLLLGRYRGEHPKDVRIVQRCWRCGDAHGPLEVAGLHASLSYGDESVAVAVCLHPVGVDIERRPAFQVAGGLDSWTRHEAIAKATGEGMASDLDALDAVVSGDTAWTIAAIGEIPGHAAHIAAACRRCRFVVRRVIPSMFVLE